MNVYVHIYSKAVVLVYLYSADLVQEVVGSTVVVQLFLGPQEKDIMLVVD